MVKGIIFDLDGTLLDSMHIWHDIDCAFLKECSVIIPDNLEETFKTFTIDECVRYFITELGVSLTEAEILKRFDELMRDAYLNKTKLKPNASEMLESFRRRGIKMCIATANDYSLAHDTLERLGILHNFDFIATCGELCTSKNEPFIYEHCAQRLGFKPCETAVFEDALHCVQAAKSAGFKVAGVYDESSKGDTDKIKEICDIYINSFEDVIEL